MCTDLILTQNVCKARFVINIFLAEIFNLADLKMELLDLAFF